MRKVVGFIISLIMIFSMVACMNENTSSLPIYPDSSNSITDTDENSKEEFGDDTEKENDEYLDKVIFVPTGDTYDKKGLVEHEKRVTMLKLMVDNVNIFVSDICKNGKYCYTYEIMDYYQHLYPN